MNRNIRRLSPADRDLALRAISKLKQSDWAAEGGQPESLSSAYLGRFLSQDYQHLIVATVDEEPVGYLLAYELPRVDRDGKMMLFYEIEVAEAHRRQGVGSALVNDLKLLCAERAVVKMWVETNELNEPAMQLYSSTGGVRVQGDDLVQFGWTPDTFR